jgi:hypothetical protein
VAISAVGARARTPDMIGGQPAVGHVQAHDALDVMSRRWSGERDFGSINVSRREEAPMDTTRERLHELLDELPEDLLDDAEAAIAALAAPPYRPLAEVPDDDEPITPEEEEAIRLGLEEYPRGETIPHDQAMREIGL